MAYGEEVTGLAIWARVLLAPVYSSRLGLWWVAVKEL